MLYCIEIFPNPARHKHYFMGLRFEGRTLDDIKDILDSCLAPGALVNICDTAGRCIFGSFIVCGDWTRKRGV